MATVLFGWELGHGLSYAQNLLRVAQALVTHGHQPIFALQKVADCGPLFEGANFPIVQAPLPPPYKGTQDRRFLAASFGDVLVAGGYNSVDELLPLVNAWQKLVDLARPALVVTDFCPTLCLTVFGELPVVQFGSWFGLPPAHSPVFPRLLAGQTPLLPQERLLAILQEVQRVRGKLIPTSVTSFLATAGRFPALAPELDGYGPLRHEPVWDPLEALPAPVPQPDKPSFFAYLSAEYPRVEEVLTGLALTGVPGSVYLRGSNTEQRQRLRLQGLSVFDRPAALPKVLAEHAVLIHHGGVGAGQSALAVGRPQLVLPQHLEQAVNAQNLHRLGIAAYTVEPPTPEAAGRLLQQVLAQPRLAEQAQAASRTLHSRPRRELLPALVSCCLQLLHRIKALRDQ